MSYPYTKPQPRFGYRRPWGDPRVGLVGSGPGRPLRTYVTDPEVGLPQRGAGLGESAETPVTSGIFNMGPAAGFNRGVFTPDPPWATPRYIASMRDPVAGVGRFGGFGDTPTCGIPELVDKIIKQFPSVSISLSGLTATAAGALGLPTSFSLSPSPELIKPLVYSAIGSAGELLGPLAAKGANAIADVLAAKVAKPIADAIVAGAGVPASAKGPASTFVTDLVNKTLRTKLVSIGTLIMDCAGVTPSNIKTGFDPNVITKNPVYCTDNGYQAIPLKPGEFGYDASEPAYKCGLSQQMTLLQMQSIIPLNQTMAPVDLNKAAMINPALLTTLSSEQQRCAADGGEWYPGGADCQVDSSGNIYNCQAPTAYTTKKYSCVPKGTAGAQAITATGVSSGSKATVPLIIGAAALAALLLTRL